jgi:hypothetical protein
MAEIARLGRTQARKTTDVLIIRGVRCGLTPKRMDHSQFQKALATITVREIQLIETLRRNVNQDEFVFLDAALDDPRAVDAVFEFLLHRMKTPAALEQERTDAPAEAELPTNGARKHEVESDITSLRE